MNAKTGEMYKEEMKMWGDYHRARERVIKAEVELKEAEDDLREAASALKALKKATK